MDEKKPAVVDAKESDAKKEIIKSVWISGLSSVTRAADLKNRFSQLGKVSHAFFIEFPKSHANYGMIFISFESIAIVSRKQCSML